MPLDGTHYQPEEPATLQRLRRLLVIMQETPARNVNLCFIERGDEACVIGHAMNDRVLNMPYRILFDYQGKIKLCEVAKFFGITFAEVVEFFFPSHYLYPKGWLAKRAAIKKIKKLVEKYEALERWRARSPERILEYSLG